ncbi:predicted protein [Uncinocarpus reesii 1704]|uniref:Uncharacterized protein n=1 Tax=Uncinocarpus reesii (strain UAMH 1704) TaxID=336963 RepID=C4JEW3_UNCRE|nr:uncharacterized protein UREG_00863 [Uncinocarpus reesii 1704]EEP76016.1 predicted protein [Uncinocarpus reesii 1704]
MKALSTRFFTLRRPTSPDSIPISTWPSCKPLALCSRQSRFWIALSSEDNVFVTFLSVAWRVLSNPLDLGSSLSRVDLAIPSLAVDVDKERTPPPPATPLDFPSYIAHQEPRPVGELSCDKLHRLLSRLKRPQDLTREFLDALNLRVEPDVAPVDLIPGDTLKSLPPFKWPNESEQPEASASSPAAAASNLMCNGSPFPDREKYDTLRRELLFDNDDAFRSLARLEPLPGRQKIRVAHARKFWSGLEHMSQYWDTSLDQYIERPTHCSPDATSTQDALLGPSSEDKMDIDSDTFARNKDIKSDSANPHSDPAAAGTTYKGRRIGTGKDMPETAREEALRGFLEMVSWSFGCQPSIPFLPPRLFVKGLLFPVRQNVTISRAPQDRQLARKGFLEGPVMIVQCRGETVFHAPNSAFNHSEACDILRETAAMLLCAQERGREGCTESKPGDGKWWATEPRWGGAPNDGPVGDEEGAQLERRGSAPAADAKKNDSKRPKHDRHPFSQRRGGSGQSRRRSMSDQWKVVQPGPGLWDKKMKYMRIGKPVDSPFDDVGFFPISMYSFA